jgi:hypothetical protein
MKSSNCASVPDNTIVFTVEKRHRTRCQYFATIDDRVQIPLHERVESSLVRCIIASVRATRRRSMNPAIENAAEKNKLADDLLRGADQIADFLFGEPGQRRKVYYLAETSRLPVFRLGSKLCARRSVLIAWIASQEKRGWQSEGTSASP